jgi:ribosomal protein S18 acetylase RimI-like enzyme
MTDLRREEHAKRLLDDELLQEAFDTLREDLMNRWIHSGSTDLEARESIWLAIRLLERIDGHIKSIVETGDMAKIMEKQHPYI